MSDFDFRPQSKRGIIPIIGSESLLQAMVSGRAVDIRDEFGHYKFRTLGRAGIDSGLEHALEFFFWGPRGGSTSSLHSRGPK